MRQKRALYAVFAVVVVTSIVFAGTSVLKGPGAPGATPAPHPARPNLPQDSVAPIIVQRTPATGEELPPGGSIQIVFAVPMDRASVESAFSLVGYGANTARFDGRFEWQNERTLSFHPAQPLPRGGIFRALLDKNARDAENNPIGDASAFAVMVTGYLEVAQVIPAPDAGDVAPSGPITVIFNRPVVPLTTLAEADRLPSPLQIQPEVKGRGEWLNTSIYQFTPAEALSGGTRYSVRVAAGLVDTVGTPLAADYTWSFSTQPPLVSWATPSDGATQVSPRAPIVVTFNQAVDPASAIAAFSLTTGFAGLVRVDGQAAVSGATLTFTPTQRLDFDTSYTLALAAGVRSAAGGEGMRQAASFAFTTAPLPRILSTRPADGDQKAYPYTDFQIEFSSALIDPATVMANLTFTPPLSPTQVYTYFSDYDRRFVVAMNAQPSTDYTVQIGPDIADVFGNRTGQPLTVRFSTDRLQPSAQLMVPDVVGTLDAFDPAQLVVGYVNVARVDLRLLRLDATALSSVYSYVWNSDAPAGAQEVRRWSLDLQAALNKPGYVKIDLAENGGSLQPGAYLLMLDAPGIQADNYYGRRQVLLVSNYNLTLKREDHVLFVWATGMRSGAPAGGLALTAIDEASTVPALQAVTNEFGVARFDLPQSGPSNGLPGAMYVLGAGGTPFVAGSEAWSNGISAWDFNLPGSYGLQPYALHVYTDRPIYRPGQKVYFRGALRADDDAHYSLPAGVSAVNLSVNAPDGSTVFQGALSLSGYGTFNGELALADGAALGQYNVSVQFRDAQGREQLFNAAFAVAAYRAPEFSVTVTPGAHDIVSGTAASAVVSVQYYFGGPVAGKDLSWNLIGTPYTFDLPGAGGYSFADGGDPYAYFGCYRSEFDCYGPGAQPAPLLSGGGRTDDQGRFTVELPADLAARAKASGSMLFTLEAVINGADGQVISGRNSFTVHQAELYVGVRPAEYVAAAGKPTTVDLLVAGWDGTRRAGVTVNLEFVRSEWINKFVEGPNGAGGSWTYEEKTSVEGTATAVTDALGEAHSSFTPAQAGSYRVRASAADGAGRQARSSTFVWVTGDQSISWRRDDNNRVTLIADKRSYAPGDTAQILVPSPFQGRQYAWVSVERGHVIQQEVIAFDGSTLVYQLPISADYAPNIYVSVTLMKGRDESNKYTSFKLGYANLLVDTKAQALTVEVQPRQGKVEPGKSAQFDVLVRDGSGQPVQGEFSFDLVDKAVLSLMPRPANAILQAFYGPRALNVRTSSGLTLSLNRLVAQQQLAIEAKNAPGNRDGDKGRTSGAGVPEQAPMPAATAAAAGQAQDASSSYYGLPAGVEIRQNFADTAFWAPSIVTDAKGQAALEIKLPDNLTTWVLRGVGITVNTQAGEGSGEVIATRPLMVRPVTPRFFVVDDRVQLAALVSNTTDAALDVSVTLLAAGLSPSNAMQSVKIAANSEAKLTWDVTALDVPYADITFVAQSGAFTDAAKPRLATGPEGTIPVLRYSAPDIVGTAGVLNAPGQRTELVGLPLSFDDRRGALTIRIDPSLAAGMTGGLSYLEHYEYECTEQTVSRFLPNVLTYKALRDLKLRDDALEARLPGLVKEGLDRLYAQQHQDGGWGWWSAPQEESNPYLSAYVALGMLKARAAGFDVRPDVLDRALAFLNGSLVSARSLDNAYAANQQSFMLYVLAEGGRASGAAAQDTFDHRDKLGHYGRAYLALAIGMANAKDERVTTLLSDLNGAAVVSATGAHWEEDSIDWWSMSSNTRSTAIVLDAFARLQPDNALAPNAVRWLMVARKAGVWSTTQETAWSLIGLTDWMVASGELAANYDYVVQLNGAQIAQGAVSPDNVRQSVRLDVAVKDLLRETANKLVVAHGTGSGSLYYSAHLQVYQAVPDIKAVSRGIAVMRRYTSADCSDGPKCPALSSAAVGQVVRVQVTIVAPHDLYYVMLEDPLPAGAEAIDPALATTSQLGERPGLTAADCGEGRGCWWWNWWNRSELRDDKVVLFANALGAGTYQYTYTFRATLPGEYRVIPSVAQEMYFPEVFGRGDGMIFTVTP